MPPVEKATPVNDPWKSPKETWQYVTVPDVDLTDRKYPSIWLNKIEFQPGETYHIPPAVAEFVTGRIKAYNRSVTRLFSPTRDYAAENAVSVGTTAGATPAGHRPSFVDGASINTL
jgi:hypothetical protein